MKFPSVIWKGVLTGECILTPQDQPSAEVLEAMAAFIGLPVKHTNASPHLLLRSIPDRETYLNYLASGKIQHRGYVAWECAGNSAIHATIQSHNDAFQDMRFAVQRWQQLLMLVLQSKFSATCRILHGGLAEYKGCGYLFIGPSGVGKSTLLRKMPSDWNVYSDDATFVVIHDNQVFAESLPTWSIAYTHQKALYRPNSFAIPLKAIIRVARGNEQYRQCVGTEKFREILAAATFGDKPGKMSFEFSGNLSNLLPMQILELKQDTNPDLLLRDLQK